MNYFKLAWRQIFSKKGNAFARILSLTLGLAFGILLITEVFYYISYDSFYADANRLYVVHENFKFDKTADKVESYPRVSGAIAPGLKAEVPGVEAATRLNSLGKLVFYTDSLKGYQAEFVLADEFVFDVLPRPIIEGNPALILKAPMQCMVSTKVAAQIGQNVIGQTIELKEYPGAKLTVAGIFKALPQNTNFTYDVLISMVSTNRFTWDGTDNWLGNDRYFACVKLAKGVKPKHLEKAVRQMQEKHQDITKIEAQQPEFYFKYTFEPIKKMHIKNVFSMVLIISAIAFAVLFVSLLNYVLLTLTTLLNRAKSSAVYKCCGAQSFNLYKITFTETALMFMFSLTGAFLLIMAIKPMVQNQLQHSLSSFFDVMVIVPLIVTFFVIMIVTAYLPGRFFSRIPVVVAFRNYTQKQSRWKNILLSVQFAGATFIVTVLLFVTMQYQKMLATNHGYNSKNIYFASTSGVNGNKINTLLNQIMAMPEVQMAGFCSELPTGFKSGNNIFSPDGEKELFNIADFYWVDENYLEILDINLAQGQLFTPQNCAFGDMLISTKGAQMLALANNWPDGVVGKQTIVSEHGSTTIRGVFNDFIVNSISTPDNRPSVMFFMPQNSWGQFRVKYPDYGFNIIVKCHQNTPGNITDKITQIINQLLPYSDAQVKSLDNELLSSYNGQKSFRNTMMAGSIIVLIVTVTGLLAYTANESTRRGKELAIRRINGASFNNIIKLFIVDLEYTALPAVIAGGVGAWFTANSWMTNFAQKINMHWALFILCGFFVMGLVAVVTWFNCLRVANNNPVGALRYE